jgi:hypothetical protein
VVEEEIAGEVTRIRINMEEFVYKQPPGWVQEGLPCTLNNLLPAPSVPMIEQIRKVLRAEQLMANPSLNRLRGK